MAFVHHHAPDATPAPADLCLIVQAERLLAAPDVSTGVVLPHATAVADWPEPLTAPLHVGRIDNVTCWVRAVVRRDAPAPVGWAWHDTRALLGALSPAQWHAVSCARQLVWWDRRHQFCGACGTATMEVVEERARRCPKCGTVFYPVVSPAIIVAVTRGPELLLAHNRNFRPGMFSLLAGFVDPGETLEQAVAREVREEVGIEIDDIRYLGSQPWSFPNSLMMGFRARHVGGELAVDGKEIETAGWFTPERLPDLPRTGTVARQIVEAWRSGW